MKRSEFKDLLSKSESELNKLLVAYRQDLGKSKIGIKSSKSKKGSELVESRKTIARILTILKQKKTTNL